MTNWITSLAHRLRGGVHRTVARALGPLSTGLFFPTLVTAAGLQVSPVLLEFAPTQRALALSLSNTVQQPLSAQVRIMAWRQVDGEDVLEPTNDLVASPPMVEISGGQQQLIRIVRTNTARPSAEMAYRVLIDELPPQASAAGTAAPDNPGGLRFLFRFLIPAFVASQDANGARRPPAAGAPSPLITRFNLPGGPKAQLVVRNTSTQRMKISNLSYAEPDGDAIPLQRGLLGYVLSGTERMWVLDTPRALKAGGTLTARIDEDAHDSALAQDAGRP